MSRPAFGLAVRRTSRALVVAGLLVGTGGAQQPPTRAGDDLVGVWGSEAITGPSVRGALTLQRTPSGWTLTVGGYRVQAGASGDSVNVPLTNGQGRLKVPHLIAGRGARAFWVHPSERGYDWATPVTLIPAGASAWRGTLAPLDEHLGLYLHVSRSNDGTLTGAFRNPDFGWNLGRRFTVARAGDNVTFTDAATQRVRFTQPYDSGQRTITFDFGAPVVLRPRSRANALGFWPVTPADSAPAYHVPLAAADGWRVAHASEVGLDPTRLAALTARLALADPVDDTLPLVHAVLVARRGRLVFEEYFRGFTADRPHDTRSAFKTMSSILAGVAMEQGVALSPESRVYATLRPGAPLGDPRKAAITLRHLFTHTTGLDCDDPDATSPGQEDRMQEQRAQLDWTRFTLDLAVKHDTGTVYAYCSGTMNLAGAMVAAATHRWLPDYFDEMVARPMRITGWGWNLTPTGEGYSGGGAQLRPRDLLKLGQLYLDHGVWNGRRIVPAAWVHESTAHQVAAYDGGSDGYAWHRNTIRANGREYAEYEMSGNGGQLVAVVPEADLVVVTTAGSYGRRGSWRTLREALIPSYILAGVRAPR